MKFIVAKTPQTYYHYKPGAPQVVAGAPAPPGIAPGAPATPAPAGSSAAAPTGPAVAIALPAEATGTPQGLKVLRSARADLDKHLVVDLNEVKLRGSIVSVLVTFRFVGKRESEFLSIQQAKSVVLNYDSGETSPAINLDGFQSGRMKPGEAKTLRATFKAPKGAKKVGITLSGLGTFDDVEIAQ